RHDPQVGEVAAAEHPLTARGEDVASGRERPCWREHELTRGPSAHDERHGRAIEVEELVGARRVDGRSAHPQIPQLYCVQPKRVRGEPLLWVLPCEQLDRPVRRSDELSGDLTGETRLVCVADGASADARNRGNKRNGDEQEPDRAARDSDAGAVAAPPTP